MKLYPVGSLETYLNENRDSFTESGIQSDNKLSSTDDPT